MANTLSGSACQLRGARGQFVKDPNKPAKKQRVNGQRIFGSLRTTAFDLIKHLQNALPKLDEDTPSDAVAETTDETAAEKADTGNQPENSSKADEPTKPEEPKWTSTDYDRLLGRHGGVVDSFRTLADLILRLTELEQKRFDTSQSIPDFTEDDEEYLDRRIADELDRLAERRGPANAG